MFFIFLMSIISMIVQVCFATLAIASGLYYLAELVEEYTVFSKTIIKYLVLSSLFFHVMLMIFEDMPLHMNLLGAAAQGSHAVLLREFPAVRMASPAFVVAIALIVVNHYFAFSYFTTVYYTFTEVLSYFTLCLWTVPLALFVSLSANDYVLPTTGERQPLLDDNVVTDYLSRKSKRYSLLSFFSYAKESILPQRSKKSF